MIMRLFVLKCFSNLVLPIVLMTLCGGNLSGQSVFQYSYDAGYGSAMIPLGDSSLIISEVVFDSHYCDKMYTTNQCSFRLLNVDTTGNVIWKSKNVNSGLNSTYPVKFFKSNDGHLDVFIDSWFCPPYANYYLFKLGDTGVVKNSISLPMGWCGGCTELKYQASSIFITKENDKYIASTGSRMLIMNDVGDTLGSYSPLGINKAISNWKTMSDGNKLYNCNTSLIYYSETKQSPIWDKTLEQGRIYNYIITKEKEIIVSSDYALTKIDINGDTLANKKTQGLNLISQLNDSIFVGIQGTSLIIFNDKLEYKLIKSLPSFVRISSLSIIRNSIYILGESDKSTVLLLKTNEKGDVVDLKQVAGTEEIFDQSARFYPNPANNLLTVESVFNIGKITIYNKLGQVVYTKNNINQNKVVIDLNLTSGLYVMEVGYLNNTYSTNKIQIEKN